MNRRSFIARLLGLPVAVALAPLIGKIAPLPPADAPIAATSGAAADYWNTTGLISHSGYGITSTSGTYTYDFSEVLLASLRQEESALLGIDLYETTNATKAAIHYWQKDALS